MLRIAREHDWLIGRLAKLTERGVLLEKEYEAMYGVGNWQRAELIHQYCLHWCKEYEMCLMFIEEAPIKMDGRPTFYCLKEIGKGVSGDWHWFTLDQLIFCES